MVQNIFKTMLCAIIFLVNSVSHAGYFELQPPSVFVPLRLGKLSLVHDEEGFCVVKGNNVHRVQKCFSDSLLRSISRDHLKKFLEGGYVSVDQMSDGEFALKAYGRLNGGGPVAGAVAYWVTKSLCYGTAIAASSTAVVLTGGIAVGAITTVGAVVATGGAGLGAVAVSGAIGSVAGGAASAVTATAATVTAAGGFAGAVAAVETASMGVSALFTLCPFLP